MEVLHPPRGYHSVVVGAERPGPTRPPRPAQRSHFGELGKGRERLTGRRGGVQQEIRVPQSNEHLAPTYLKLPHRFTGQVQMQASSLVNNTAIIQSYASTIIPESVLGLPCHVPLIVLMGVTAWRMTGAKWTIQLSRTRVEAPRTTRELIHIKAPPLQFSN